MASGPARDSADVELELAGSWRSASPGPRANGLDDGEDGEERAFVADEEDSADGRTVDELFDDERIGQANRTQLAQFALSSFAWFPAAFLTLTSVFTARVPDWVCAVEGTCSHAETGLPLEICDMDRELWKWVDPKSSIVSEWDLVCSHEYKVQLADSIFFVGFLAGAGILGQVADSKGRVFGLYLSTSLASAGALFAAASNGYWLYFWCMCLRGFGCGGLGVASYVLCTEVLGIKWRAVLGIATQYYWSGGIALMAPVAYMMPRWRSFATFCGLHGLAYILLSCRFLLESPRWYLATGQIDKAHEIMTHLAKGNDKFSGRLPPLKQTRVVKGLNVTAVFPYPALRQRLVSMAYIFCVTSMVYYGLSLNVGSLSGSIYMNTFISGIVEFPSHAFAQVCVDILGRQKTLFLLMGTAAVGVLSSAMFRGSTQVLVSMIGRFGIAGSFNMIYLYTTELFPTIVRSSCLGTCSLAARVGGIIAPGIILAQAISAAVPPVVLGLVAGSACMVTLSLPETQGVIIEESLADAARQDMTSASRGEVGFTRLAQQFRTDGSAASRDENEDL
jgi:OCT family organic cation transporter-like MFS transporter 4/5